MITTEHIMIKRGIRHVVNDISWDIDKNQHWILFGLNGCGKTTLLGALAGYSGINKGTITIEDDILLNQDTKQNWRIKTGFVSASFFDHCYHTEAIMDIILSGLYGRLGITKQVNAHDITKVKSILSILGLVNKHQYPYDTLSSGQRQKVLLARALINDPEVLFLDEPFNGLDILGRMQVQELLDEWKQDRDKTIICVTHHCEEITPFYTHAALMKDGKFFAHGQIQEIFTTETMSSFLAKEVSATWEHEQLKIELPKTKGGKLLWAR